MGVPVTDERLVTVKMGRVVHAVIKGGTDYRPFFEGAVPSGRTPLPLGREARATQPCRQ